MPDTFSSTNILDFYFLEAMMDRVKRLPEVPLPSQEKWKSDLKRHYDPFVKGFAASIRDYLFVACMGEARHGYRYGEVHFPEMDDAINRSEAYRRAIYFSLEKNVGKLSALFNEYGWHEEGYGGTKWGAVATALELYGQVPDAVFIDVVASIEHNNGNVFSKYNVCPIIPFKCNMDLYYNELGDFLNYKARYDILSHPKYLCWLSRETLTLLSRYYAVKSRKDAPREIQTHLSIRPPLLPKEYEPPWGDKVLGDLKLSPREEEYYEEEIYDDYADAVSSTPKVPRE